MSEELDRIILAMEADPNETPESIAAVVKQYEAEGPEAGAPVPVEGDPEKENPPVAESKREGVKNVISEFGSGFWGEENLVPELKKALGSKYQVEEATWYGNGVTITNSNKVSKTFNWDNMGSSKSLSVLSDDVLAFIDADTTKVQEKGPEWVEQEELFKGQFLDQFFEADDLKKITSQNLTEEEVKDQVFDLVGKAEWSTLSPSSWFGEGRTQFSALGDQDLRDAIGDRYRIEKGRQESKEKDNLAAEWLGRIENGELDAGIGYEDWLKNRRATDIATLADDNEKLLAALNVDIMHGDWTSSEMIALTKQRDEVVESMNAPTVEYDRNGIAREGSSRNKYTMVRDLATGELIRKPEGSEWDDAVDVEPEIEAHQQNLSNLVDTRKKHLTAGDILEAEYNRVSLALANIENEWSEVGSYNLNNLSSFAQDENGVLTTKSGVEGQHQQQERSGGKIAFSPNMDTKASFGDLVKIMRDQEKGYHEYAHRGSNGENRYYDTIPLDNKGKPVMTKEEFLAHTKRRRAQKQDLELRREALKRSYLLNEDVTSIEKRGWQNAGNLALSSIFGQDNVREDFFGGKATEREVIDAYADTFTSNGIELTSEQQEYVDRSLGEVAGEGLAGSAGILLEFAVANKVTAGLRAAKLFKQGYKVTESVSKQKRFVTTGYRSLDDILSSAKGPLRFHRPSKQLWSQGRIEAAAAKAGMSVEKWLLKNAPKGGWQKVPASTKGLWAAKVTEAVIEGLKFKAIGGDFSVGMGFGAAGQVVSPILGTITSKTNLFGFTPKYVAENHKRLEKIYNLSFKGPSSFMIGSEIGELSLAMSDDMMNGEEMGTFLEHHYPDLSSVGKRWASNYLTGVGFGFTHKVAYTKSENLNSLTEAKTEAEGKYLTKRTDYRIRNNKTGEEFNSPSKGNYKGKDFTILEKPGGDALVKKEGYKTEDVVNPITGEIIEKGRTVSSEQATIENAVKYQELADHHARAIRRSQDALDFVDEQLGQFKMEQDTKNQREIFKEYGMDVRVERGNTKTMGNRDAEVGYEDKDGNPTPDPVKGATAVFKYNVDRYAAGLAPHELGHVGMHLLFGRDARFKGDFLNRMMDMTKSIKLDGGETLHTRLTERYGGFGKGDFEAAKLNDWEVFSHLVQELKKPENLRALRKNSTFSQLKDLVKDKIEPELNHKYNLTKESDIVRFFGNYIESINKGNSSLGVLKHLDQVIDAKATEEGASLRRAYEKLGIAFGERGMASVNLSRRKELIQDNIRLHSEKPEGYAALMAANVTQIKSLDNALVIERGPEKESDSDRKTRVNKIEAGHRDVLYDRNAVGRNEKRQGEAIDAIISSYRGKTIAVAKSQGRFETPTFENMSTREKEDFVWSITQPELLLHLDTFNRKFRETDGKEGVENDDLDAWLNSYITKKLGTALNKPGNRKGEFTDTTTDMRPDQEPVYTPEDMKLSSKTDARLRVDIRDRMANDATPERAKEIEQGVKELNDFVTEFVKNKPSAEIPGSYGGLKNIKVPKTILDKVFGKNTKERIVTIAKTLNTSKSSALPQGTLSTRTGNIDLEGKSIGVANTLQTVNISKKGQPQNLKEVLYGAPKGTAEFTSKETGRLNAEADPTGQGNAPKELLKLSRAETLKRLGIREVELGGGEVTYEVDNTLAKEYASEPGAKSEKDIMRNMDISTRKSYMEEVVRGMTYQAAMENLPEMARKLGITTEVLSNQISAGKARLASENLGRVKVGRQLEFLEQLSGMKDILERHLRRVPSNLDLEDFIKAKEQAVVSAFKERFAEYQLSDEGKDFNLSTDKLSHNANLTAIAKQLNQQFKFSGVELLPEALHRRATQSVAFKGVRAIEHSLGLPVYGVNDVFDYATVMEARGFYRTIARETILNHGIDAFDAMFGSGLAGGGGIGRYRNMSDLEAGINAKSTNRHAHFLARAEVRALGESVLKELQAEGLSPGGQTKMYNGSPKSFGDLGKKRGVLFLASEAREAKAYADSNGGKVRDIYVDNSKVGTEKQLLEKIEELGYSTEDALAYELIDTRFPNSLKQSEINKVIEALKKDGILGISYTDGAQVVGGTTKSTMVFDKSIVSEKRLVVDRTISDKTGDAGSLFKHIAFGIEKGRLKLREDFDMDKVMEAFSAGEFNKTVLSEAIETVKKAYDKPGGLSHKAVRSILEGWFGPMLGLGKKSSSLAVLPDMTLTEMIEEFGEYSSANWVLEHITPANYIKARVYDYLLSGKESGVKKEMMRLTLRDAHTTFIPKTKDTAVNKILQDDMGIDYAPGMNPIKSRYWFEGHLTNFDFPLKVHGGEYSGDVYSRTPNMSHKEIQERRRGLRESDMLMLGEWGMGSENLSPREMLEKMKVLDKALANGKKRNAERKGMSTWDFDDTLATTKSGVRVRIPNPDGTPKPGRKVVFMAGGAGSGKGNVISKLGLEKAGYKIVNSDISLEWLKKNHGLPENQSEYTAEQRSQLSKLSAEARKIAKHKQGKFAGNGDGVVVDGTGGSIKAMEKLVQEFKDKGYDASMIFVETSLEVAQQRNAARKERSLREGILNKNHEQVQGNKEAFKTLFGETFNEVSTDKIGLNDALPEGFKDKVDSFTNSYENRRLDAEEFAKDGAELKEIGGEFDFSEFNKVKGGEPGPFLEKALERAKKFGTKDQFILTARPPEAAPAIHEFLKSQGLEIPLENIVGLGNGTPEAKAQWMLERFAEGYNDMYFADDVMQNVKAVKDVLSQLDTKSKVQQARRLASENLSLDLNKIIERTTGIGAAKKFSGAKAEMLGRRRWTKSLVVPGAQDFMGLMQNFLGKGKQGNADIKFFEDNLVDPFARATKAMNEARQKSSEDLKRLYKDIPSVKKKLNKTMKNSAFTYDQAIRSYLWEKAGYEIPGLSARDLKQMTDVVKSDGKLLAFADGLMAVSKGDYVKPSEHWVAETIVSDLFNLNNRSNRSKFLEEWKENKDIIFSEANMNKIEATQGAKFREALEDMLYRMETGSNRPSGSNKLANAHMNFINGSVGATMFLNMRSAALQTISATNYINWAENNPAKAAAAFGNQKQYWKDFSMIWNSPMLKQRRAGLEYNVQEAELAAAVAGQKNKAKAAMAWLIKKGFTPTQLADSFAIAAGGSTYYRNRVKMYKKKGLSEAEAMEKSFLDFQEKTEVSQQSSRADLISQQQASTLGRTVLAWANTPMQYMRIQEKAARNIINGRGDFKTNVSQISYYGLIQSLAFASLQSALFAYGLDDEEDLDPADLPDRVDRVINTVIDGQLRGLGVGGAAVSAIKNTIIEFHAQEKKEEDGIWYTEPDHVRTMLQLTSYSPVIGSKLRKLYSAGNTWNWNRDVISEMGLDLNNPGFEAGANVIEATTNIPIARLVRKIDNLKEVADSENQHWQRIAHLGGYSSWDVGTEDEEMIAIKIQAKENKKIFKDNEKETELESGFAKDQAQERKEGKETTCSGVNRMGVRCSMKPVGGGKYCTVHQKVDQRSDGEKSQCSHIKSDGKRCKMQTSSQSGKCYYHD